MQQLLLQLLLMILGFADSGTLLIGSELITYTGKTATTFTGCTRASLPYWHS